jgi:hypothetical protein
MTTNKSEGAGQGSGPAIVTRLQTLIGYDTLLLPWPLGSKGTRRRWKHLTFDAMSDPTHLAKLAIGNIGVAQGDVSNGLCSIDLDIEGEVEVFLALNPKLATSLRTKGKRGCNVWFRATGESHRTIKIETSDGAHWGEFRANGSQTILYGRHPSGCDYRFLVEAPPVEISVSEIVWPPDVIDPFSNLKTTHHINPSSVFCTSVFCASVSLCDSANGTVVLANIEAANKRREALKQRFPQLVELYEKFIEPKFQAAAGHRNGFIVQAAPIIFRVVCAPLALQLVDFFYQMHRHLFKDSPEQHHYEAQKMLESVAASYCESLSLVERKIYDRLPDVERDAFRILRDLALWSEPKRGAFEFFMSCKQLGDRLLIDRQSAYRLLLRFEYEYGLITCVTKGKPWTRGEKPEASVYRWLLI